MKRPEGFDPARRPVPPARPAAPPTPPERPAAKRPKAETAPEARKTPTAPREARASRAARPGSTPNSEPKIVHQTAGGTEPEYSARAEARAAAHAAREARRELTRATRVRRKWDRVEARRFTRRSRNRKMTLGVVGGFLALMVVMLAVAVYSPILALQTVRVDGADQIDEAAVLEAVDDQIGTPLALIDFDRITTRLGKIPLIRSYVTETVPPDTLVIHVVERQGIGVIKSGSVWNLVDAAGVTLSTTAKRPADLPQIAVSGTVTESAAFAEATKVLRTLSDDLRERVVKISATTDFNVTLTLKGKAAQQVVWGNAEESEKKARVLGVLIRANGTSKSLIYNVASPEHGYTKPKP